MNKITILSILLASSAVSLQAISLSGTAVTAANTSNISAGDTTFLIVDTSGGDTLDASAFGVGLTLTAGTSFGDYYVAAQNAVAGAFGAEINGNAVFNLTTDGGTAGGDKWYIVGFAGLTGDGLTLSGGNTFGITTDASWVLDGNNSGTFQYGIDQLAGSSFNGSQFTVVPEPSTFAALAGMVALACVMVRRRK